MDKKTKAKYTELIGMDSGFKDYIQIRTLKREDGIVFRFARILTPKGVIENGLTNYQEMATCYSDYQKAICVTVREVYDEVKAGKSDWSKDFRTSYFNDREKSHIKTVV